MSLLNVYLILLLVSFKRKMYTNEIVWVGHCLQSKSTYQLEKALYRNKILMSNSYRKTHNTLKTENANT